jgi:YVTN family beta-propeller protein
VANQSSGNVSVIETATNSVVATVPAGVFPEWVAITPDGASAYVADLSSFNVQVIDTASNAVIAAVPVGGVSFGVAITPPAVVPFSAMTAKAEIDVLNGEFELTTSFTLGAASKGIHPLTEDVKLQIGAFSITIPAGSFKQNRQGRFVFEGVVDGVRLEANIAPLASNSFKLSAEGEGASLGGTANPVTVSLTIGKNSGSTSVTAEFE